VDISGLSLWFACGLGAAAFAAVVPLSKRAALWCVVLFGAGAWWIDQPFAPSAAIIGVTAALVAGAYLLRAPQPEYAIAFAGLLAGWGAGVMEFQGLPSGLATLLSLSVPLVSAHLRGTRPLYAPPRLREEALLFVIVLGLAAAAAPTVAEGWHAAARLNLAGRGQETAAAVIPVWTLGVAAGALVSGGIYSHWSRR
jgi:hypothetical protein